MYSKQQNVASLKRWFTLYHPFLVHSVNEVMSFTPNTLVLPKILTISVQFASICYLNGTPQLTAGVHSSVDIRLESAAHVEPASRNLAIAWAIKQW